MISNTGSLVGTGQTVSSGSTLPFMEYYYQILYYFQHFDFQKEGTKLLSFIWKYPIEIIIILILVYLLFKLFKKVFQLWIAFIMYKKLVFIKVALPRSDSRIDKDKETKKDFRETVAIMQQLYRALYEIKELNFKNMIMSYIFKVDRISFEMFLDNKNLYFYVVTLPYYKSIVEKQITTFYPDADIEITNIPPKLLEKGWNIQSYQMKLQKESWYPIQSYKKIEDDPLNDITNAMSKVTDNERAAVQIVIRPINNKWRKEAKEKGTLIMKGKKANKSFLSNIPILGTIGDIIGALFSGDTSYLKKSNAPGASGGDSYVRMLQTEEEMAKAIGEKAEQVGFEVAIRLFAASKQGNDVVDDLLNNMVVSFNVFNDYNVFQNKRILFFEIFNTPLMYLAYKLRLIQFFHKPNTLSPSELATMYHFPNSNYNKIPVIYWLPYKVLPAPIDMPEEGIIIGENLYRGARRKIRILNDDRTRHMYIIGKSGSGKSVLLNYMARQDIINGEGVGMIDPHGDLIEDVLCYVPKERARDVIVFDPGDMERPMGLNLLEANTPEEMDRASLDATEIFIKLFGDEIFGPRIQHYFRNGCLTLMEDKEEGATLIDVPRLFTDDEFIKYKVTKSANPIVKSFWEHEYAQTGDREKQEMIPYFSSKFGPFITNTTMRNIIGQTKSAFNIRECMDNRKVLLVNLSKGKIGDLNAQLLGLVLVNKVSMAALSRGDILPKDRKDFFLYVDEFQNFATDTFATILSEARKYRLSLIMAHQYINQLVVSKFGTTSTQIKDAVFGNVGTMMSFKVGAEDAEYLAKEYAPLLSEQDIIGIANYKAYIKLNIHNTTSRPFSIETIWDETNKNPEIAEVLKKYSRLKYGRKKIFVDQEIEARLGIV